MRIRHSPIEEVHLALGAKLVAFGGWEMPLNYPAGTLREHMACRSSAAVFDVSHLGTVRVEGRGSFELLQRTLTNDLRKIAPGHAQYTHLLGEDGSVLDDIIVWWVGPDRFDVMANASNTVRVREAVGGIDVTERRAVIAVQGPSARRVLAEVSPEAASAARFAVVAFDWRGSPCVAAGTGYTGEDGVECAVPAEVAPALFDAVLRAGALPAGLGARDTLRLEAGLPLHGHELGPGITPLQAGLGWVVAWGKGGFPGRAALEAERAQGPRRLLRGLVAGGRRPPRAGDEVLAAGGPETGDRLAGPAGAAAGASDDPGGRQPVEVVTSGNFSPVLQRGIALAFLAPDRRPGEHATVAVRGDLVDVEVVTPPFVGRAEG